MSEGKGSRGIAGQIYRELFNNITDAIFFHEVTKDGLPGNFIEINDVACRMLSYSRDELLNLSVLNISTREQWDIMPLLMEDLFRKKHHTFETDLVGSKGILVPCEISAHVFTWRSRNVVLSVARDITERNQAQKAIKDSQVKFRTLFESNMDGVFIYDIDPSGMPGNFIEVNECACRMFGYTREEILSITARKLVKPEDWLVTIPELLESFYSTRHSFYESHLVRKDGSFFPAEISAHFFELEGQPGVLAICRDISERKKAEADLVTSEKFRSSLLDNAPYPILVIDPDRSIRYVNRAMEIFTGFSSEELLGKKEPYPWWHRDYIEDTREYFLQAFCSGIEKVECRFQNRDGDQIWAEIHAYPVYENDKLQFVISNLVDITLRKGSQKQLEIYQKKLRDMASELDIAEERERKSIAEKIHDSIGQNLALLKIKSSILGELISDPVLEERVAEIVRDLDQVISFTRDFLFEVSPPILYELGFEPAVRWLGDKMFSDHSLRVKYEDDGQVKPMSEDKKAFLFRSLKELLMNVIKHAGVGEVFIRSYLDGDQVILEVEDRGKGFDMEEMIRNVGYSPSFGLFSIRERVHFIGGNLEISSRKGRGTMVTISLPVDDQVWGGE